MVEGPLWEAVLIIGMRCSDTVVVDKDRLFSSISDLRSTIFLPDQASAGKHCSALHISDLCSMSMSLRRRSLESLPG